MSFVLPRALLTALAAVAFATGAARAASPFAPPAKPQPKAVRLLAPSGLSSSGVLAAFEQESGVAVAYDAYGDPAGAAAMLKTGAYDVAILPGPELARAAAQGALRRIDRTHVPDARGISPQIAAKLASYDPNGYALAWGWSPTGLIYDAGKVQALLGGAPASWTAALAPAAAGKLAPCGVALPDSRDDLFIAAWRLMGVDPARPTEKAVTAAADLIIAARAAARVPASRDPVGALAGGAACLAFGGPLQAESAERRSRAGGDSLDIRYAAPREGGAITIQALAEPRDPPHPAEAAALIAFLLRPAEAREAAAATGLLSAQSVAATDNLRALWPAGVYDARLQPVVEKEWARIAHPAAAKAVAGKGPAGKGAAGKAAPRASGKQAAAKSQSKSKSKPKNKSEH